MDTSILPSIFVPIIGLILPVLGISMFFVYVERDEIS
jgi:photosystem I reaction center subunit VIII